MARKPTPQALELATAPRIDENIIESGPKSAPTFSSPQSPRSAFRFSKAPFKPSNEDQHMQAADQHQIRRGRDLFSSPTTASFTPSEQTPPPTSLEEQELTVSTISSKKGGFFNSLKQSRRLHSTDTVRQVTDETMSKDLEQLAVSGKESSGEAKDKQSGVDRSVNRRPVPTSSRSDTSFASSGDSGVSVPREVTSAPTTIGKKSKPKPFGLLSRTKSIHNNLDGQDTNPMSPIMDSEVEADQTYGPLKTAPLRHDSDRYFKDLMPAANRNHSADRQRLSSRDRSASREKRDFSKSSNSLSTSLRENGSTAFLNNLKSGSSKAVNISRGFFNKVGRSGSTTEKQPLVDDDHYQLRVLNLPLVDQTRKTRISKKLETANDKTEFWMPSFPWRAIDYLNQQGIETEGLYRVPGSGPQIKKWQRKFDEELDIDLLQQNDLYDINIIGSMLKAWLRELPDEILPKAIQEKVSRECAGADSVPQLLVDELANLPPFNYYLLFAITCHLSLLLEHSDKNKMNFHNLCICFQPCLRIDRFCFKFLVVNWAACWKGCVREDMYIEKEYQILELEPPMPQTVYHGEIAGVVEDQDERAVSSSDADRYTGSVEAVDSHDERAISSSDSSKPSSLSFDGSASTPLAHSKPFPASISNPSILSTDTVTTTLTIKDEGQPRNDQEKSKSESVREVQQLSPIAPLSPMEL